MSAADHPERQRVLAERVNRAAVGRVIDATTAVPLETFESPDFHDHLARAHTNAQMRPFALARGHRRPDDDRDPSSLRHADVTDAFHSGRSDPPRRSDWR